MSPKVILNFVSDKFNIWISYGSVSVVCFFLNFQTILIFLVLILLDCILYIVHEKL